MDYSMEDDFFATSTGDTAWSETRDAEWNKISEEFTNAGYREGITAGKEAAVQSGFDTGFAEVGVPLGRYVGLLRGYASAILAFLVSTPAQGGASEATVQEARKINLILHEIRYSDIEPRDEEAERHAREHLDADDDGMDVVPEQIQEQRKMEKLEDMLAGITTGPKPTPEKKRPTMEDIEHVKSRLWALLSEIGLPIPEAELRRL